MARIVFRPDPKSKPIDPTDEKFKKQEDFIWNMYKKHGGVCITDPTQPVTKLSELVKNNPYAFTGPGCDYHGDMPLKEFIGRAKNGEFDPD